jgi:alkylation response protein AidB-like acyl-CoA dehydrogenase
VQEEYNDIHAMLRNQACGFMMRALGSEGEARSKDPRTLMKMLENMTGAGYPGICIPTDYGGEGGGLVEACIVVEETAVGEPNLALMLMHHLACSHGLMLWAGEEQKRRFLPSLSSLRRVGAVAMTEPEAGSDLAAIKASLVRRTTELVLNGNKCFVTNIGPEIDCLVLGFFREPSGLSCALVPSSSPGFHIAHHYRFAGWEGLPNHALVLQDCSIPADHLITDRMESEPLERWSDSARLLVTAVAAGMIRTCMEEAMRYCGERRQFGKRLAEHQSLLFRIADISLSAALTRTGLMLAASRSDEGVPCHAEICMLKLFATTRLEEAASSAMEMAGGYGYTVDSRLSSLYRDAKGLQLLWGTREMLRLEIARSLDLCEETTSE